MKILLQRISLFAVLCLMANCQTVGQERINPNVSGFTALKVSSGIDVYLTQGDVESVEIEASEELMKDLRVEVDNSNALVIRIDSNIMTWFSSRGPIKAYVSFKQLNEIQVSGGSDLYGQGTLEFENLQMHSSGGSDIKLALTANELDVQCSGGSDIVLEGYTSYFKGSASGGSDLKAKALESDVADISTSGGSDAQIKVNRKLIASASGGSDIVYYGNPGDVDSNESGGSDIKKR